MRKWILFYFLINSFAFAEVNGIYYFDNMFGHLHQQANSNSISLTTLACGHPIKMGKIKKQGKEEWFQTQVGAHDGFLRKDFVVEKKPECFQSSYPAFFNTLNLDLAEMYYWGRLFDQYITVEVRAQ